MSANQPAIPADADEIERAIRSRQDHLAATVDELTTRLQPKNLLAHFVSDTQTKVRRAVATAQDRVSGVGDTAKSLMAYEDGTLRTERVAGAAAGVAGTVLLVGWLASRHRGE